MTVSCAWCRAALRRKPSRPTAHYFCNAACKGAWQRLDGKPVTEEWLRRTYVTEGLDCVQIAALVERDPKSVWAWLKGFGIPTRPRGVNATATANMQKGRNRRGWHHTAEMRERLSRIAKADGRVPYDPAVGPYSKGRFGEASLNWKGGITPERQAFHASPAWVAAVKIVWKRDDATCQRCGLDARTVASKARRFATHHIDSFQIKERRAEPDNLVLLCTPCHLWIHSNANTEGKWLGEGHRARARA